ncbi:hypothetical protein FJY63_05845 [Candidatus Sumerlaeota bacterium]|nr:hypothetical protein [Candidatus Sumerlaeota bacterium]
MARFTALQRFEPSAKPLLALVNSVLHRRVIWFSEAKLGSAAARRRFDRPGSTGRVRSIHPGFTAAWETLDPSVFDLFPANGLRRVKPRREKGGVEPPHSKTGKPLSRQRG